MRDHHGSDSSEHEGVFEARLLSVLDTAVDAIIVIDENARVLVYNKACERLFGYPAADMIGRNVKAIMPPRYSSVHDSYIDNYRRTGEAQIIGIGRQVEAMHRDGTVFPVDLSVGEATTPDGRQFTGILSDGRPAGVEGAPTERSAGNTWLLYTSPRPRDRTNASQPC